MKKNLYIIIILAFLSMLFTQASAQIDAIAQHPIDAEITNCYNSNPSKLGIMECEIMGYQKWKAEVNRVYTILLGKLDEEGQLILKEQHLAWEALIKLEFELNEKLYAENVSLLATTTTDLMRKRAMELQSHLDVLQ
jgi:uncharacterized protein YecT (DUF1311 family)